MRATRAVHCSGPETMKIRTRKFVGTIGLLVLAITWSLFGMVLAQFPLIQDSKWMQAGFYVVVGLGWVLPAMPIVSWMSRPDRTA
jgi:predicted membrane channel-forming protein YqfA (hemolysin III family)